MRITHVITRLIVGGAQENTLASVLGLHQRFGLDVRLISGPTAGPEGSLESCLAQLPGRYQLIPSLIRPVCPWRDWQALRHLRDSFRQEEPQVVHTHSGKAGILGRLAAAQAGVPVIVHTIHGPSFGPFQGPLANALFRNAERAAGRVTTHFVTVAHAMTRQYLAAGIGSPDQYTRILSGFDLDPFLHARNEPLRRAELGLAPTDFVVGKVARLFKLKGHEDLFEAAPRIVAEWPSTKFLLVGDGPWRGRFERRARDLGLSGHFVFTGLVPPASVAGLIGLMDVVVHLSRREGLPRALPQALAAGKPVVAYDCDGASEVCINEETGFLVEPGRSGIVADRVLRLARDPALRERLGAAGREFTRDRFSLERMIESLFQLYERLVLRPHRTPDDSSSRGAP